MENKDFIPYEEALALKELGFNEPCFGYYIETGEWIPASYSREGIVYPSNSDLLPEWVAAPTFSQAFRWFREKYNLIPNIHSIYSDETHTEIKFWFWFGNYEDDSDDEVFYGTYEEAELACLKKLIELIK